MRKIIFVVLTFVLPLSVCAEIVATCESNGLVYSLDLSCLPASSRTPDEAGLLTLSVHDKSGEKSVLASIKRPRLYRPQNLQKAPNVSLVVANGNAWIAAESYAEGVDLFYANLQQKQVEIKKIAWPFGGNVLMDKGANFSLRAGVPVLTLHSNPIYGSPAITYDFVPWGNNSWVQISDGLNEIFIHPETSLEWALWRKENVRKRNALRKKNNPEAILYPLPKAGAVDEFLLENPGWIDTLLARKVITEKKAEAIRKILRRREQEPEPQTR